MSAKTCVKVTRTSTSRRVRCPAAELDFPRGVRPPAITQQITHVRTLTYVRTHRKWSNLRVPSKRVAMVSRKVFWGASNPFITGILLRRRSNLVHEREARGAGSPGRNGGATRASAQPPRARSGPPHVPAAPNSHLTRANGVSALKRARPEERHRPAPLR